MYPTTSSGTISVDRCACLILTCELFVVTLTIDVDAVLVIIISVTAVVVCCSYFC